jgi:hypothetical protein
LWSALAPRLDDEGSLVLLEEACRIADRLDQLDVLLRGDAETWTRVVQVAGTLELRVDSALIEARQQASVLRQIIAGLPVKEPDDGDDPDDWLNDSPA